MGIPSKCFRSFSTIVKILSFGERGVCLFYALFIFPFLGHLFRRKFQAAIYLKCVYLNHWSFAFYGQKCLKFELIIPIFLLWKTGRLLDKKDSLWLQKL